jgi:hypothetical protein
MSTVIVTKESFFSTGFADGKSFSVIEKEWLASGYAIKRGKSAKDNIVHAWLANEVSETNLKEWLAVNGTDNDVKQSSYYANRIQDFNLIVSSLSEKKQKKA